MSSLEDGFTAQLVAAFKTWSQKMPGHHRRDPVGLPVGATASRVIANVLLHEFDRMVKTRTMPVYYARYVDDIFMVIHDNGGFSSGRDVLDWVIERMDGVISAKSTRKGKVLSVNLSYAHKSRIQFQPKKQRVFLIDNSDLLDAIQSKIEKVTSEWRLLPDMKQLEKSAAAKTLSTSRDGASDGDALRKTDSLLLRRLGLAVLLRNLDAIADNLPADQWRHERTEFYEFALRHVVVPAKLFELADYLPRLISIAVYCGDWRYARRFVSTLKYILSRIRENSSAIYMGKDLSLESSIAVWNKFVDHVEQSLEEAMLKALSGADCESPKQRKQIRLFLEEVYGEKRSDASAAEKVKLANKLFCRDLARNPFKSLLLHEHDASTEEVSPMPNPLPEKIAEQGEEIADLLRRVEREDDLVMPVLFPTRPMSGEDISVLLPNIGRNIEEIKYILNTVRGTYYGVEIEEGSCPFNSTVISIGNTHRNRTPRVAVTSFLTRIESWCSAAGGDPDCSAARFERLVELCNAILRAPRDARPDYVLFPELSVPRRWIRTLAEPLLRSRISVIVGEEYTHHKLAGEACVDSTARLFLTDDRLGYPSWCALSQQKGKAAHHEATDLKEKFGLTLAPSQKKLSKKFIFDHFGFKFGLLICSELTDMRNRLRFRGRIDSLFVLSWNQDLESFAALVDASALDIHCFVALVNNRMFGDSRIRAPYKESWLRDLVRVKGGLADYFVVAKLDVAALRDFQSHHFPPGKPFKPFPEGFKIIDREVIPGTDKDLNSKRF